MKVLLCLVQYRSMMENFVLEWEERPPLVGLPPVDFDKYHPLVDVSRFSQGIRSMIDNYNNWVIIKLVVGGREECEERCVESINRYPCPIQVPKITLTHIARLTHFELTLRATKSIIWNMFQGTCGRTTFLSSWNKGLPLWLFPSIELETANATTTEDNLLDEACGLVLVWRLKETLLEFSKIEHPLL